MNVRKAVSTYVDNIDDSHGFSIDNIVVEHRSNNPKRDFLFVNKSQCSHIPKKPGILIDMCKTLAKRIEETMPASILNSKILIIGFAETATAIGNLVADNLPSCRFIMTTTREDINEKTIIEFKEEHSHAPSQRLVTYGHMDIVNDFDYILFVEDEISTGNTIINFVNAIDVYAKANGINKVLRFGVASICNWQDEKHKARFKDMGIDVYALIYGQLKDPNAKMQVEDYRTEPFNINFKKREVKNIVTRMMAEERFGHVPNRDLSPLMKIVTDKINSYSRKYDLMLRSMSVRVIGTEECKYLAVKVAEFLEENGIAATCQSTTRSPIDVLGFGKNNEGIACKYKVPSVYEKDRECYIYNIGKQNTLNIIVTDAVVSKKVKKGFKQVLGDNCLFISYT